MAIYTRNEAADIVELFEDLLERHGIVVPSEDDDQKEDGNTASLYGMEYWNLLDDVERVLVSLSERSKAENVVSYEFE